MLHFYVFLILLGSKCNNYNTLDFIIISYKLNLVIMLERENEAYTFRQIFNLYVLYPKVSTNCT